MIQLLRTSRWLLKTHMLPESCGPRCSARSKPRARNSLLRWVKLLKWNRFTPSHKVTRMVAKPREGIRTSGERPAFLGYTEDRNLKARKLIRSTGTGTRSP